MKIEFERSAARETAQMIPLPLPDEPGLVVVDTTWGTIQPFEVADGVRTVGELDISAHLKEGLPLIDGRMHDEYMRKTIPGATNVPYTETATYAGELNPEQPAIFFCNGPQCGQSPAAIRALLNAGAPPEAILYYRGGLHDWITLGLEVAPGTPAEPAGNQGSHV